MSLADRVKRAFEPEKVRESMPAVPVPARPMPAAMQVLAPDKAVDPRDLDTGHIRGIGRPVNDKANPAELTAEIKNRLLWQRAYLPGRMSLQDLHPYRIIVAWRLSCDQCRCKGLVHDDETLLQGLDTYYPRDPWVEPIPYTPTSCPRGFSAKPDEIFHMLITGHNNDTEGIALLPPPVPEDTTDNYNPHEDNRLLRYIEVMKIMSDGLGIPRGSAKDPDMGRFGLMKLFDPGLIRILWPTRTEIVAFEDRILNEAMDKLVEDGYLATRRYLVETYGLIEREAQRLIKISRLMCRLRTEGVDLDDERALHLLRLEELVVRARTSMDVRAELAALKQIALVLGLGRSDPEDVMKDFVDVIHKVADEPRKIGHEDADYD